MKTKKTPRKSLTKNYYVDSYPNVNATRSILYLLIVMLAGSIFFLFRTYQDSIIANNMFVPFMSLTVVAMALLISLLFLVNPAKAKRK